MSDMRRILKSESAWKLGRLFKAALNKDQKSLEWCATNKITKAQVENINSGGGFLVPADVAAAIIALRDAYGVFRANAQVVPMSRENVTFARRTGGLTGAYIGEGTAPAQSAATFDNVSLVSKKYSALVLVSTELLDDSAADLGQFLSQELAWTFAQNEDNAGWLGDGTSTYAGQTGIATAIIDGNHAAANVACSSGVHTFATITGADLANLMAALPANAWPGSAWYISEYGFSNCMCRLAMTSGGTLNTIRGGAAFNGRPVVLSQSLPASSASFAGKVCMAFGDLSLSTILGDRRQLTIKRSNDRYFDTDQVGIMATERFTIVNHSLGNNTAGSNTSPLVGLVGTS
ncbi:MAG: phage major capsid protein [Methyloceanibacter sp.]